MWREHAVVADQIDPRPGNEHGFRETDGSEPIPG
jgi:hypothetical protein